MLSVCLAALPSFVNAQILDSLVSPGTLSRAHQDYTGLDQCTQCHVPGEGVPDRKCLHCHMEIAERVEANRGLHRLHDERCVVCHPEHQGGDAELIHWEPEEFQHSRTGYPLAGLHQKIEDCKKCHSGENALPKEKTSSFLLKQNTCIACHQDVHRGQLGSDCQRCHDLAQDFSNIVFDHSRSSFALQGAHQQVECSQCHPGKKWKEISFSRCTDCHGDPHHPSLGPNCTDCHNDNSWKVTRFNHVETRFPLVGQHRLVACEKCHTGPGFRGVPFGRCRDCHSLDPHLGQLEQDCLACHSVEGFEEHSFKHNASRYPLTGRHELVECSKCHPREVGSFPAGLGEAVRYRPLSAECVGCHQDLHFGQFLRGCDSCHSTLGFGMVSLLFEHNRDSKFKLEKGHAGVACKDCHGREEAAFPSGKGEAIRYLPISDTCLTCHEDQHAGQLSSDCEKCHTLDRFTPAARFDHANSRFPLVGKHPSVECRNCHPTAVFAVAEASHETTFYRPLERECLSCHGNPHQGVLTDDCLRCHTTSSFSVERFDHSRSSFGLTGRHAQVQCDGCHPGVQWQGRKVPAFLEIKDGCISCHQSPHRESHNDCERCHSTSDWRINDW